MCLHVCICSLLWNNERQYLNLSILLLLSISVATAAVPTSRICLVVHDLSATIHSDCKAVVMPVAVLLAREVVSMPMCLCPAIKALYHRLRFFNWRREVSQQSYSPKCVGYKVVLSVRRPGKTRWVCCSPPLRNFLYWQFVSTRVCIYLWVEGKT